MASPAAVVVAVAVGVADRPSVIATAELAVFALGDNPDDSPVFVPAGRAGLDRITTGWMS